MCEAVEILCVDRCLDRHPGGELELAHGNLFVLELPPLLDFRREQVSHAGNCTVLSDEKGVDKGGCVNVLINDAYSFGGTLAYNTCLAQVQKA